MREYIFTFEEERIPPAVVLTTIGLIGIFVLGFLYQLITALVF